MRNKVHKLKGQKWCHSQGHIWTKGWSWGGCLKLGLALKITLQSHIYRKRFWGWSVCVHTWSVTVDQHQVAPFQAAHAGRITVIFDRARTHAAAYDICKICRALSKICGGIFSNMLRNHEKEKQRRVRTQGSIEETRKVKEGRIRDERKQRWTEACMQCCFQLHTTCSRLTFHLIFQSLLLFVTHCLFLCLLPNLLCSLPFLSSNFN